MPHLYSCRQCRTSAPERRDDEADARADRRAHRFSVHGGHAPMGGDSIERVHHAGRGDGVLPRHTFFAMVVLLGLVLANCWGR